MTTPLHVVVFPFMSKGHTIPIFDLARFLTFVAKFASPSSPLLQIVHSSLIPFPTPTSISSKSLFLKTYKEFLQVWKALINFHPCPFLLLLPMPLN
uniref:Putative ovule protein n=1 Tax=Solanum chacoense TaxID=4108 RepID=A0A0V0HCC3_SOLCH